MRNQASSEYKGIIRSDQIVASMYRYRLDEFHVHTENGAGVKAELQYQSQTALLLISKLAFFLLRRNAPKLDPGRKSEA